MRKRLDVYHAQTEPLVDYYARWAATGDARAPKYRARRRHGQRRRDPRGVPRGAEELSARRSTLTATHDPRTQRLLRPVGRRHRRHQRRAAGVIETARKHRRAIGKVYAGRNGIIGALTEDLIDTSREPARAIRGAAAHAGRRVRLVPLQAEGLRREPRAVRAADRGVPRARHRLFLLQRRQRLRRHLPQGVADRGDAGLPADRRARAQDRRQRSADHRQLPRLRLGREVRRDVDARGGVRRRVDGEDLDHACSCSR